MAQSYSRLWLLVTFLWLRVERSQKRDAVDPKRVPPWRIPRFRVDTLLGKLMDIRNLCSHAVELNMPANFFPKRNLLQWAVFGFDGFSFHNPQETIYLVRPVLRHFPGRHQIALSSAGQPKDAFARSMFAQQLSKVLQVLPVMLQHPANSAVEPRKEIPWANAGEIRWKPQHHSYNPNFKTFFCFIYQSLMPISMRKCGEKPMAAMAQPVSPFHHPAREPGFADAIFSMQRSWSQPVVVSTHLLCLVQKEVPRAGVSHLKP